MVGRKARAARIDDEDNEDVPLLQLSQRKQTSQKRPRQSSCMTITTPRIKKSPRMTITPSRIKKSPRMTITPSCIKKSPRMTITPSRIKKSARMTITPSSRQSAGVMATLPRRQSAQEAESHIEISPWSLADDRQLRISVNAMERSQQVAQFLNMYYFSAVSAEVEVVAQPAEIVIYKIHDDMVADTCAICLCDLSHGEKVRLLPCMHKFHPIEIAKWIKKNPTCPLCKTNV